MTRPTSHQITLCNQGFEILVLTIALSCANCGHSPEVLVGFRTEQQAQEHCPKDTVVWVDPQSSTYFLKASASYERPGAGRYACRADADRAGMHEMANRLRRGSQEHRYQDAEVAGLLRLQ